MTEPLANFTAIASAQFWQVTVVWVLVHFESENCPDFPGWFMRGVEGGSKWRRRAVEFGGAGLLKVSKVTEVVLRLVSFWDELAAVLFYVKYAKRANSYSHWLDAAKESWSPRRFTGRRRSILTLRWTD